MNCPRCRTALQSQVYESDIQVDACPTCGGMWLDEGELSKIQQTVQRDYAERLSRPDDSVNRAFDVARQKARPELPCPKCGRDMFKRECQYASLVLVDLCPHCAGVWLDRGEVEALEVFAERLAAEERREAKRGLFARLRRLFGGEGV